jgi:hypothetical protein
MSLPHNAPAVLTEVAQVITTAMDEANRLGFEQMRAHALRIIEREVRDTTQFQRLVTKIREVKP